MESNRGSQVQSRRSDCHTVCTRTFIHWNVGSIKFSPHPPWSDQSLFPDTHLKTPDLYCRVSLLLGLGMSSSVCRIILVAITFQPPPYLNRRSNYVWIQTTVEILYVCMHLLPPVARGMMSILRRDALAPCFPRSKPVVNRSESNILMQTAAEVGLDMSPTVYYLPKVGRPRNCSNTV